MIMFRWDYEGGGFYDGFYNIIIYNIIIRCYNIYDIIVRCYKIIYKNVIKCEVLLDNIYIYKI